MDLQLINPIASLEFMSYQRTYHEFVSEMRDADPKLVPFVLKYDYEPFQALIAKLENCSNGIGLSDGFVPHTTFWLINSEKEIVGVSNIRHSLNPKLEEESGHIGYGIKPSERQKGYGKIILHKSLAEINKMGIPKALVTCDKLNIGSAKIIKSNGGVLEDERYIPRLNEVVQRYWIELSV